MLDLFGIEIEVTWLGVGGIALAALAIGLVAQLIGEVRTGYEWVATALGAFVGAVIASEWLGAFSAWGTTWEGVAILPALTGGLVLGAVVDVIVRTATGGSYVHAARPA